MLPLLAAFVLTPIAYHLPTEAVPYNLDITFDGYVPLFGLNEAKVDVRVGLTVKGAAAGADGNQQAVTDISDLKISVNGGALPFGKDQVKQYFPNTVTLTPQGKVVKNDAPDVEMPVQLPGLDVKRFPDITFLAVEFPVDGIEVGKPFTYSRQFGSSAVNYVITPTTVSDGKVLMDLKMTQDYDQQEGDSNDVVKNPKDAVYDVKTHVEGTGQVEFDRLQGLIRSFRLDGNAVGTVTKLDTKAQTVRKLKTHMDVELKK